jgi:20S proteasome alpha/beta subunit
MTVIIAARCADLSGNVGRAVVVGADRMVSGGLPVPLESTVAEPKIRIISDRAVMAITGAGALGHLFATDVAGRLKGAPMTSSNELVQGLAQRYANDRRYFMEQAVFGSRGLSIAGLYGGANKDTAPPLAGQIDSEAKGYQYGFEFLMGSIDASGGHVHGVGNPGMVFYYDEEGFATIGQGAPVARLSLLELGQSAVSGLLDTVFGVYASVRRADVVTGVGMGVDIYVIREEGITQLSADHIERLSDLYDGALQSARETMTHGLPNLGLFAEAKTEPPKDPASSN